MGITVDRKNILLKNNAKSKLASDLNNTDTSLSVLTGEGIKFPTIQSSGEYFYATIQSQTNSEQFEIVKVIATSGDTFTIERGQEGTSPTNFISGDLVDLRVTKQLLEDISYINIDYEPTYNRVYYDTMVLTIKSMGQKSASSFNYNKAPRILEKWNGNLGNKVKNVIFDTTNGIKIEDDIQFPTKADIDNYVNNNAPLNSNNRYTSTWILQPYDEVDQSLPIPMFYPFNQFYGAIKGRNNYNKYLNSCKLAQGAMDSKLLTIYKNMIDSSVSSLGNNEKSIMWLCGVRNMYSIPSKLKEWVIRFNTVSNLNPRMYRDNNDGSFSNVSNNSSFKIAFENLYAINDNSSSMTEITNSDEYSAMYFTYSIIWVGSMMDIVNSSKRALYLKPFGIDKLMFYPIDFNNYSLEAIMVNNQNQYINILTYETLNDVPTTAVDLDANKFIMNVREVYYNLYKNMKYNNHSQKNYPKVYFRIRDKNTNKVSNNSKVSVTLKDTTLKIPMMVVKQDM